METAILQQYLERPVIVHFAPHMFASPDDEAEEGQLLSYDTTGILLKQTNDSLLFIPIDCIRSMSIRPLPSFWQRLTGAV